MTTSRNIAIFLDGTWNETDHPEKRHDKGAPTNVLRLFDACKTHGDHYTFYIPGVGTDIRQGGSERVRKEAGLPNEPLWFERLRGGVLGEGLTARVLEAYGIICSLYRPLNRDRLFIFGFSRGAFAARSLVNFIARVGILFDAERELTLRTRTGTSDLLNHVQDAYRLYESTTVSRKRPPANDELQQFLERIFQTDVLSGRQNETWAVRTHFMGLWDTVATRGLPQREKVFRAPRTEDEREAIPPSVMCVRHALAAHEFRSLFEPLMIWGDGTFTQDVEQRWFPGSHADVGGGYAEDESGLAIEPLHWIAEAARAHGLAVSLDLLPSLGSAEAQLHKEGEGEGLRATLKSILKLNFRLVLSGLLQIRAHRSVRHPLQEACALRLPPTTLAVPHLRHANSALISESARELVAKSTTQRHRSWRSQRPDLNFLIASADGYLERLLLARACHLYDQAVARGSRFLSESAPSSPQSGLASPVSLRWALSMLVPSDKDTVLQLLASGSDQGIDASGRHPVARPVFSQLGLLEQGTLAALLAVAVLEIKAVDRAIEELEALCAREGPRISGPSTLTLILVRVWSELQSIGLDQSWSEDRRQAVDRWIDRTQYLHESY